MYEPKYLFLGMLSRMFGQMFFIIFAPPSRVTEIAKEK